MGNTNPRNPNVNYSFLLWWVLANLVGLPALVLPYGIGYFLVASLLVIGDGMPLGPFWHGVIFLILALSGALIGAWLGLLQWLPLQARMVQSGRWIRASSFGVAIGTPLGWLVYGLFLASDINFSFGGLFVIFGILLGLTIGVSQWFVLRQQVDGAGWWIIVVPGCFALGLFYFFLSNASALFNAITALIGIGCFTGILLMLLLQFPNLQRAGQ